MVTLIAPRHNYVMIMSTYILPPPKRQPLLESLVHVHFMKFVTVGAYYLLIREKQKVNK